MPQDDFNRCFPARLDLHHAGQSRRVGQALLLQPVFSTFIFQRSLLHRTQRFETAGAGIQVTLHSPVLFFVVLEGFPYRCQACPEIVESSLLGEFLSCQRARFS